MYKIKQIPEDFVVKEILSLDLDHGNYSYYLLKKINYSTIKTVEKIAERLRINKKYINFAGNKDKKAVTEQFVSINKGPEKGLQLKDISLEFLGKGKERINLGSLEGNEFIITVRNLTEKDLEKFEKNVKNRKKILNYFDEQRFGFNKNNHIVGKLIVKKDFKKACSLIEIDLKGNDFVGALKRINKKVLRLYVHAYQSYLWNETVNQYLNFNEKIINKIPIIGFSTEMEDEDIKKIIKEIMEKEGINFRDFIIREIPEISSEGGSRDLFVKVKDFKIMDKEGDELNIGKRKIVLKFALPKGCYATIVVRFLFHDGLFLK